MTSFITDNACYLEVFHKVRGEYQASYKHLQYHRPTIEEGGFNGKLNTER